MSNTHFIVLTLKNAPRGARGPITIRADHISSIVALDHGSLVTLIGAHAPIDVLHSASDVMARTNEILNQMDEQTRLNNVHRNLTR